MLTAQLMHIDSLDEVIEKLSREIEERMHPFEDGLANLQMILGVGERTAEFILSEVSPAMNRFPSHRHLASWAGLCPGNNESAGKRHSGKPVRAVPISEQGW
ncbi:MAG TPA: transposase [Bacillota bacterium]|nr:transposase [Bacillota bacterium]